jgi:DNA (cytosine-5)-methyltransferase 1
MIYSCIDSFCGAGGMRLGLESVGYNVPLSFDFDPHCVKTQELNPNWFLHPAKLAGIDEMLNGNALKAAGLKKDELFLLAGGPPCQGFSVQRIGDDTDERNDLISKFISLVSECMPQWFLMENVPGIAGKRGKLILDKALKQAASLGYWIHQATLDAQDFGVPQRRKRVFIVGEKIDGGFSTFQFPVPITPKGKRLFVKDVISTLPEPPLDGSDHPEFPQHRRDKLSKINIERLLALKQGQGREYLPEHLLADCHKISSAVIGHRNVYGRMSWDDVAPTITARFDSFSRGLFGHPEQTRTISLREGAILQTFPLDFVFAGNKVDIARQIGNAVPPKLAAAIGKRIIECHQRKTQPQTALM